MRGSGRVFIAGFVLTLFAAAGGASAAGRQPVTVALLSFPADPAPAPIAAATAKPAAPSTSAPVASSPAAPSPPPAPMSTPIFASDPAPRPAGTKAPPSPAIAAEGRQGDDTSWGIVLRGGYFGLPNSLADLIYEQHPDVAGSSIGGEIRYHGEGGGRGVESIGLAVDYATVSAAGIWQQDDKDSPENAHGEISMLAITLTGYWSLFPSWYVHPYFGIGIGVAHAKGHYEDEDELVVADYWIPVLHIPVGLAVELGKRLQLAVEGRFIDGIAIGGALQVRF